MKFNIEKREKTPSEKTIYSLEPNEYTNQNYSFNVVDISLGFPYGFSLLSRKKNKNTLRAFLGFEKSTEGLLLFLLFRTFKF